MSDPFGLAPIKREGGVSDPDAHTWECDLDKCEECRTKYNNWKQKYLEEEERLERQKKKNTAVVMEGVREYCEEMEVRLRTTNGRLVIEARNEGGHNSTEVDLLDLLEWLRANEHLVMSTQQKEGE